MLISCFFSRSEDDCGHFYGKFHKWHNGGGAFHESACIDSSAFVDVGAVVHSESVVGPDVRIGSGTVVGPSVNIGHSTRIGYCFFFSLQNFLFLHYQCLKRVCHFVCKFSA